MMGLIKIAGVSAALAAGFVAVANLPQEANAAPAPAALAAPAPALVQVRLPEEPAAAQPKLRLGQDETKPADPCAGQAWPYISPACMAGDDRRPARRIRVIGAGADAGAAIERAAPTAAKVAGSKAVPVESAALQAPAPRR
jgi:hypothetical protein